jgi:hypothetical protein
VHTKRGRQMRRGLAHFYAEAGVLGDEVDVGDPYAEEAKAIDLAAEGRRGQPLAAPAESDEQQDRLPNIG